MADDSFFTPVAELNDSQARAEHSRLTSNLASPYWNDADPSHKEAIQRVLELALRLNPEPNYPGREKLSPGWRSSADGEFRKTGKVRSPGEIRAEGAERWNDLQYDQAMRRLQDRLGSLAPEKLEVAREVVRNFAGTEEDFKILDETGLSNDSEFIELLFKVGGVLREKGLLPTGGEEE
jgi:hypothetical protein